MGVGGLVLGCVETANDVVGVRVDGSPGTGVVGMMVGQILG